MEELKEKLRALNAKTSGNKAELVKRLIEIASSVKANTGLPKNIREGDEISRESGTASSLEDDASEMASMQRELEFSRKEQELTTKELELAKREIELLQNMQRLNAGHSEKGDRQANFGRKNRGVP